MRYFLIIGDAYTPERFWTIIELSKEDADKKKGGTLKDRLGYIKDVEDVSKDWLLNLHFTPEQLGYIN